MNSQDSFTISIGGKNYQVLRKGHGIPCLAIGTGILTQRSLSDKFFEHFNVYASDLYFVEDQALDDITNITMDTVLADTKAWGEALGLDHYVVLGHSAFGILALEFAKKYPEIAQAIIMIGTPINWNPQTVARNNEIFHQHADEVRKKIDAERRTQIAKEDLSVLTSSERWFREYIFRDAPRYWHQPDYDCSHLWQGIVLDRFMDKFFDEILPNTDVTKNLEAIKTPIFLAAGLSDYDCCPWTWQNLPNLPPNMTISLFEQSGHWPQYEQPELFDQRVIEWVNGK